MKTVIVTPQMMQNHSAGVSNSSIRRQLRDPYVCPETIRPKFPSAAPQHCRRKSYDEYESLVKYEKWSRIRRPPHDLNAR